MVTETPVSHPLPQNTSPSTINVNYEFPGCTCTQYNTQQTGKRRNLVVCIDGTSNQFGQNNTNVVKLFAKVDNRQINGIEQHAYYSSGIGTRPQSPFANLKRTVSDKLDMAIAWNVEEIVKDAYGWLVRTYREGDKIYLFGFSRGAYQVRVLAGMIYEVGLIQTLTEKQIGTAYTHYYNAIKKPETRKNAREFKDTFSWKDLHRVHFVGVWDTVSSVGFTRGNMFLSASSSAAHACHFRHALALDERRVKFMPEYFHEMNLHMSDGNLGKSKYANSPDEQTTSLASEKLLSTETDSGTNISLAKQRMTVDVKEVWFAGSHSDVGGRDKPGALHQAGNVSLLWMRREATEKGLVLQPTDIVWMPDDLDFGVDNSMGGWEIIEHLPIKHQVSFSGAGENALCFHRGKPRRIIPGQKVHASILYANIYRPRASLGEGFDIPPSRALFDEKIDKGIWDTSYLFDVSTAQTLVDHLDGENPLSINLDRLLFMLQFEEGKQHVRKVPNWQNRFLALIRKPNCRPLVKLAAIVAYYEASYDSGAPMDSTEPFDVGSFQDTLDEVRAYLLDVLKSIEDIDGSSVLYLLGPLAKHKGLRDRLLTSNILDALIASLDIIIDEKDVKFGKMMDTLNCLLQCEGINKFIINKLGGNHPRFDDSRLSRILKVKDTHHLIAALRMVSTLARILSAMLQEIDGKSDLQDTVADVCSPVKPEIRKLAACRGLVGPLAIEILLILYDPNDRQINIRNPLVRENFAKALLHSNPDSVNSADSVDDILSRLYGFLSEAKELDPSQKTFISELAKAVGYSYLSRQRTAATMSVLRLCESKSIRTYLLQIKLLDTLVDQLRSKDKALLAAYALANCLKYGDMKEVLKKDERLSKNIVHMLKCDYFDDAIGSVEGFQIFRDFMQYAFLREKIKEGNIAKILEEKLGKGIPKETRTSLILLDIFHSFDLDGPWTRDLVDRALGYLRSPKWDIQKAGVTILSALARTDCGVAVIQDKLRDVFEMLPSSTHHSEPASPKRRPSSMLGPAYALCILAQNKKLRILMREMPQYSSLKHLYLSGTLVDHKDPQPWHVYTPNRADVINVLDKMIKTVDDALFEEESMSMGDSELPHIQHWNHLLKLLGSGAIAVALFPVFLGFSAIGLALNLPPMTVSATVLAYKFVKTLGPRIRHRLSTAPELSPPGGSVESEQNEGYESPHDTEKT